MKQKNTFNGVEYEEVDVETYWKFDDERKMEIFNKGKTRYFIPKNKINGVDE